MALMLCNVAHRNALPPLYAVGGVEDRSSLRLPWMATSSLEFSRLGGRAGHRRAAGSIKGQLYLLPEPGPAKFENIDQDGLHEAGYGPDDFE